MLSTAAPASAVAFFLNYLYSGLAMASKKPAADTAKEFAVIQTGGKQ